MDSSPPFSVEELMSVITLDDTSTEGWKTGNPPFPFVATITGRRGYSPVTLTMHQSQSRYIPVESQRHSIHVDLNSSDDSTWYSGTVVVKADFAFGLGPNFKLLREGTFRSWLKRFGYQDIELGNQSVDFELTIKGTPEDQIKDVLLPNIDVLQRYVVTRLGTLPESDTVRVEASMPVSTHDRPAIIEHIRDLVDLVAGIASSDLVGLKSLRELPDNRESWEDNMPVVSIHVPTQVDFCPTINKKRFVSRARVLLRSKVQSGKFSCCDASKVEEVLGLHGLGRLLAEVGDAKLIVDEHHAQIVWPDIVTKTSILLAAAKLLVRIATRTGQAVYR